MVVNKDLLRQPYPKDVNYQEKLWISNNKDCFEVFYYDEQNDKWVRLLGVGSPKYIAIQDTEPTEEYIVFWIDTSQEPYTAKVRTSQGWKIMTQ